MNENVTGNFVLDTPAEKDLGREITLVERKADELQITNTAEYEYAGQFIISIKKMQDKVKEYWEPMRKSTYDAYNSVNKRKKEMMDPLEKTERTIKNKISGYMAELERKRREQEEAARRLAQLEAEKKLKEAAEAEQKGDYATADFKMAEAEVMDDVAKTVVIKAEQPKVTGIAKTKAWRIKSIDSSKVPVRIAGAEIRPVDEKAVMALIKATKGGIEIPGIVYEEYYNVSVRK